MTHAAVEQVRTYLQAIQLVEQNAELSAAGKANRKAALQASLTNFKSTAYSDLKSDWAAVKRQYDTLTRKRLAEEAREADDWDYTRLAYETGQVEKVIRETLASNNPILGHPPVADVIAARYSDIASGGNRIAARAWAENAPAVLRAAKVAGVGDLLDRMKADAVKLRTTPEMERIAAEGDKLTRRAIELDEADLEVGRVFGQDGGPFSPASFAQLRGGFDLKQSYNSDTGTFTTTLSYSEPAAEGAAAPAMAQGG